MNRYDSFRRLMDFFADEAAITDADMKDYLGRLTITAKSGNQTIEVQVTLSEEEPNAEEV